MMTVYDRYFPLGLGTSRFPISGPDDTKGIDQSIALVCRALDYGVNYIDTSYPYSAGMAQTVLREAFTRTNKPFDVTVKVMLDMDKTADDARRRAELQLRAMGLPKVKFFTCWTIFRYCDFQEIMRKGGIYEGALRLKEEGLIEHICFSTHAQPEDIIKIIKSGAFEGVTISYSMLNSAQMQPVLNTALECNVGVTVMNPLGGGLIAQNQDFFAFARAKGEENTVVAAMRHAKAHPAVKIVLSGVSSEGELAQNIKAFTEPNPEPDEKRLLRVSSQVSALHGFCTGCNYCASCPAGIPISEIMKKRNSLLFNPANTYNRTELELLKNIKMFYSHVNANEWFPDTTENPCMRCGQCEAKCTQKLNIMDSIADTFERAENVGYSLQARKERVAELLLNKGYKKVGLYPNGGFANLIVELYEKFFGKPDFEWLQFNSDPKMWGQVSGGMPVYAPEDIRRLRPDIVIVCTYKHASAIYDSLRHYEAEDGVQVVMLHRETDVPWVY